MQDFSFDVNDILNEKLMPVSMMMFEGAGEVDLANVSQRTLDDEFECITKDQIKDEDGTFQNAFHSMGYHRKMINNFLCSKFVAEQILDELRPSGASDRLGVAKLTPEMKFMANNSLSFDSGDKKSRMLYDEGSYEYKKWLAKWVRRFLPLPSFTKRPWTIPLQNDDANWHL